MLRHLCHDALQLLVSFFVILAYHCVNTAQMCVCVCVFPSGQINQYGFQPNILLEKPS